MWGKKAHNLFLVFKGSSESMLTYIIGGNVDFFFF